MSALGVGGGIIAIVVAMVAIVVVNAVYVWRYGPGTPNGRR